MAETTTRHYIIGVIMMMFFVVGGISLLSLYKADNPNFDQSGRTAEFNDTFNKLSSVQSQVDSIKNNFNAPPEWGAFGALNALIKNSWNTFSLIFTSWGFMDSVFGGLNSMFGIPVWVSTFISLLITVILAFAIYTLIFNRSA